jgi:hypothetical protein
MCGALVHIRAQRPRVSGGGIEMRDCLLVSTTSSAMKPPTSSPRRNTMPLSHIQATLMLISLS